MAKTDVEIGLHLRGAMDDVPFLRQPDIADYVPYVRQLMAEAWDEAAEETADWMANNPGPSGIPHDPPSNPYEERA